MKKVFYLVLALLCVVNAVACKPKAKNVMELSEPCKVYTVQGETEEGVALSFLSMPSVTLFEDGAARLSQPLISSAAPFGDGAYTVDGDVLTVIYENHYDYAVDGDGEQTAVYASFRVSDGGDTLTLLSSNAPFAREGAVYKYYPVGWLALQETPKVYIADDENADESGEIVFGISTMPQVTLFESGAARLSQPMISSFAMVGNGVYVVDGDVLTVTYENYYSATEDGGQTATYASFRVSDGGDTLTLLSSNLMFTRTGTVYKYRSRAAYLSRQQKTDGEKLTLKALRKMEKQKHPVKLSDFAAYEHYEVYPDYWLLDIDGEYMLKVTLTEDGKTHCLLERNYDGEIVTIGR